MQTDSKNFEFMNSEELALRWRVSSATLARWRMQKIGPPFLKLKGRVLYRVKDIENYETQQTQLKMED